MKEFKGLKVVETFLPEKINDHPRDWYVGDFLHEIWRKDLWILKNFKSDFRHHGIPFIVTIQGVRTRQMWRLWKAIVKTTDINRNLPNKKGRRL